MLADPSAPDRMRGARASMLARALVASAVACAGCTAAAASPPPGIHFPAQPVVTTESLSYWPIQVGNAFVARPQWDPGDVSAGFGSAVDYDVRWQFDELGAARRTFASRCVAFPEGIVEVGNEQFRDATFACTPTTMNDRASGEGPWLVLPDACAHGHVGFGTHRLELRATLDANRYLLLREHAPIAAIEVGRVPFHGVWVDDGVSYEEHLAIAYASSVLYWMSDGDFYRRVCS